ncbi:MAG: helix-hairpin-helix domain-containing protein [Clostridia bacterium]|nr:helix-hairpin-helix domain-containing protein [Clostridia bacterium]
MAQKENKRNQFIEKLILFIIFVIFAALVVGFAMWSNYVPMESAVGPVESLQFTTSKKAVSSVSSDVSSDASSAVSSQHQTTPSAPSQSSKLNINTATLDELDNLPGIGPAKAKAIIEYRENTSMFYYVEDILYVSGIGEKTFEQIKDLICIE